MNRILEALRSSSEYRSVLSLAEETAGQAVHLPAAVTGLCEDARKVFLSAFLFDTRPVRKEPVLCLVPDEKEVARLRNEFSRLGVRAVAYPARDYICHNITFSHEFEHERLSALNAILGGSADVILTVPDALLQITVPQEILIDAYFSLRKNKSASEEELIAFLGEYGYSRVDMVDGTGQFSVRGGIVDVFAPGEENPIRVEFFDTEVERISFFDILTQRRISDADEIDLTPAREVLISPEKRQEIAKVMEGLLKKETDPESRDRLLAETELVKSGEEIPFADRFLSLIYPQKECLLDYFSEEAFFLLEDYNAVKTRVSVFERQAAENLTSLAESGLISTRHTSFNRSGDELEHFLSHRFGLLLSDFAISLGGMRLCGNFTFQTRQTIPLSEKLPLLLEEIENYRRVKYRVLLSTDNAQAAYALKEMLFQNQIPSSVLTGDADALPEPGVPAVTYGDGPYSFELPNERFAAVSMVSSCAAYGTGTLKKGTRTVKKKSARERILSYTDIEVGDYVVHDTHGIGKYLGLQSLSVDGFIRDFVKIQYAGSDVLYLPCNQLDALAKYIGSDADSESIRLSRMGGAEWTKAKTRVKAAAKEMAKELIQLYATRLRKPGFAFSADDDMQRNFEESFPFEETDGQIEAVREIKKDMQKPCPMDRLLCGDVGFGKTEVAIRAAFKAVSDSKQVAILVPTTILALQHYQTLTSRMRSFPIRIDMLSRFRTKKEQEETIRRLKRGETDIVVGTHRLISQDVSFKDLGLVIVDEEQRFGVAHKEHLKTLAENVDVLTLTATPIPRTMNMAMSGIRDMSILEEAPQDRLPVQTYVSEYDETILSEAIARELRRGGQVFYLHNNIETIDACAARVSAMAPDARVAVAHGQMDMEYLSDIWKEMLEGKIDIFVCTTIIETGIDVPNANTLIIENADKMGLSQLHQIRGRIGRSSRRAYAYFTFARGKVLSEIASKRLSAIREYTEFGSGFKVALRDMEIRGAGNLLGEEQHGHMAKVGYDMYMKLLNEAILEEKGEKEEKKTECTVELRLDAYIPEKYIKNGMSRIDAYKKIALVTTPEDAKDVASELSDRFGKMPNVVENLLGISLLRSLGSDCRLKKIEFRGGCMLFYPERMDALRWTRLAAEAKGRLLLNMSSIPYASLRTRQGENILTKSAEMLMNYLQLSEEKV